MTGFRHLCWIAALLPMIGVARSQSVAVAPEVESVTVIGTRDQQRIEKFIDSFAAPTASLGKLARWEAGICPVAVGLRPEAIRIILDRLRKVATEVGAPVNADPKCKANIEIVFTTQPQELLNNVRRKHSMYLGFSRNGEQADKLATVSRPIQAWYLTQSRDFMGMAKVDSSRTIGIDDFELAAAVSMGNTTGSRTRDGRKSELYHVIIVIDPNKLVDYEVGSIADYISFLSLSQLATLDQCQQLPSIMDMLVPNCPAVAEMTPNDIGFLRGLYKMPADGNLLLQKRGIISELAKGLSGN